MPSPLANVHTSRTHRRTQSAPSVHLSTRNHRRTHSAQITLPIIYHPKGSHRWLQDVKDENYRLHEEVKNLRQKLEAAEFHAKMAREEVEEMSRRLNAKQNKATALPMVTASVGWLTSARRKELHQEATAIRAAKQQKKDEAAARKVQEEADKQKCHQDIATGDAVAFTGSLASKKVAELRDIAYALGLKDDGKKESLVSSIRSHLESHAELRTKARFAGLYVSRSQKRQASSDKNLAPPTNCHRITPPPFLALHCLPCTPLLWVTNHSILWLAQVLLNITIHIFIMIIITHPTHISHLCLTPLQFPVYPL